MLQGSLWLGLVDIILYSTGTMQGISSNVPSFTVPGCRRSQGSVSMFVDIIEEDSSGWVSSTEGEQLKALCAALSKPSLTVITPCLCARFNELCYYAHGSERLVTYLSDNTDKGTTVIHGLPLGSSASRITNSIEQLQSLRYTIALQCAIIYRQKRRPM